MGPPELFLQHVDHRFTGNQHGVFRVPTRRDKRMSGSFRILDDGRLLIHDFAGDSAAEMLAAVGLQLTDLYPAPLTACGKPERRSFWAADALRCVAFEALVCAAAAAAMAAGEPLSAIDRERLVIAAERLRSAATRAGV